MAPGGRGDGPVEPDRARWADPWHLRFEGFEPSEEGVREALCAIGNGYLVSRAAAPESRADGVHYPGTYLAGVYNRAASQVGDHEVVNEDLVNCPDWQAFTFRPEGGEWFEGPPAEQRLDLDLRRGVLTRELLVVDGAGRRTRLVQRRIVSQARPHMAALQTELCAENWSGSVQIRSALDGTVANTGVPRYRKVTGRHLVSDGQGVTIDGVLWLQVFTVNGPLAIALAARHQVHRGGTPVAVERTPELRPGWAAELLTFPLAQGEPVTVEKAVVVATSRDRAIGVPQRVVPWLAARAPDFAELLEGHTLRWAELWRRSRIEADFDGTLALHLNLFHLLQTCSEHSADLDVGVPARGLHGEAYRGHIFWDELFVLRVLNLRFPELAHAVLLYRYRRLEAARLAARDVGLRGAMYPWQSGSDGREESQRLHLNPMSGRWLPDHTHLQRHVGSAIAYNIWQYYQASGDLEFMVTAGAETLLEIARFWSSSAEWNPERERYSIRGVLGPDEYHDAYPWSDRPGLDDNTYTNVLASWVLARALDCLELLPEYRRTELRERLALDGTELDRWQEVGRRLHVPFHQGVLSQFDGYDRLAELDWVALRERHPDPRRLDRILEAEGDSVNNYKASKQADVLMLAYLFSPPELRGLLRRLGYRAGEDLLRRTTEYYLDRTAHGSTLSAVVHAWVLTRVDRGRSWRFFRDALTSDLLDLQGGTTAEGIHLGAMAGAVDLLQRCYTGLELRDDVLWLDPQLPSALGSLALDLHYREHWGVRVAVDRHRATVSLPPGPQEPVPVRVRDRTVLIPPGGSHTFAL